MDGKDMQKTSGNDSGLMRTSRDIHETNIAVVVTDMARDTDELARFRSVWREELGLPSSARTELEEGDGGPPGDGSKQHTPQATSTEGSPLKSSASDAPKAGLESGQSSSQEDLVQSSATQVVQDSQSEATSLYWMGVAAEQSGDVNGALLYYKRATHLDPDVESRASHSGPPTTAPDDTAARGECCESDLYQLISDEFHHLSLTAFCQPKKATKETHISTLPVELLRYILRWVVSSQLDMRCLEQMSLVSKGFYLLAREPQLWRSACRRMWGEGCQLDSYNSWRRMFIMRPHLHFNGVYISKTSYVRQGERSLDGFYKPFHTVTYFRYLRFFVDGSVMYLTTPEEPSQVVSKLCHKHSSEVVLLGTYHYQDQDGPISIDVVSEQKEYNRQFARGRNKPKKPKVVQTNQFHMELLQNKHKTKQLTWVDHYCTTLHIPTGQKQVNQFSINYMYTPFYFSRVKSFTLNSTGLL